MTREETIFALSSGAAGSAIAVIRISGGQTSPLLQKVIGKLPPPRELALRSVMDIKSAEVLDKAMVVWLPRPRSFTGEDCAELHLHGSPAILSAVMRLLSSWPGVRPAEPGEFTRRAFINGKMDLVEVEGLGDLIAARTAVQRRQAFRQMSGQSSSAFEAWREKLLLIRADIEASVDFADEPGVAEAAYEGIDQRIRVLRDEIDDALGRSAASEIVRDGLRVVLAGHPNTGKSSLLNALARRDAAIVSDIPGTTRDAIEVVIDMGGLPVILTDTAGLRQGTTDVIEKEGMLRAHQRIRGADVVIWVWSSDIIGSEMPDETVTPDLIVRNKLDLAQVELGLFRNNTLADVSVSTRSGAGLSTLTASISALLRDRYGYVESALFATMRQKQVAERSIRYLNDALDVRNTASELKAECIRRASEEFARLTGRIEVEEWLGTIFSRFCIGK